MAKLILLAIVIWLLILVVKRFFGSHGSASGTPRQSEDMVECSQCGIHFPRSEGFLINQKYYCCEAHSKENNDANSA